MFSKLKDKIKGILKVIFWIMIFYCLGVGISKLLYFIPNDFMDIDEARMSIGLTISFFLIIALALKKEKTENEIYKWKNKEKINNTFNKHIFEEEENNKK